MFIFVRLQMRRAWKVVCAIKMVSGWTWDDTTGATITQDTASSWEDYVARHPEARPFRNRGWLHARNFEIIMPSSVSGVNVFIPTATPSPTPPPPSTTQDNTGDNEEGGNTSDDGWEVCMCLLFFYHFYNDQLL